MPALLTEAFGVPHGNRIKNSVQVHACQVQDIPWIPAGDRKHGHIGKCQCVQESVHAALQQFKERLPHRIFSASGQHTVFKNMEHAGIILRQRPECNRKHDVFGFIVHPEYLCAGPVMFKQHSPAAQFFAVPDFFNGKAGKTLVHFESHAFVSPCSREFSPCLNQYFYCSPLQFLVKMRQEFRGLRGIYILYCKDCISTVGRRNAP